MKRFAAIVTIAVVVLAMTAGPALASVCSGSDCGQAMVCTMAATRSCPILNGSGLVHGACGHPMDGASRDAASVPSGHQEPGFVVTPLGGLALRSSIALGACVLPLVDARGAPHLTAVIRI